MFEIISIKKSSAVFLIKKIEFSGSKLFFFFSSAYFSQYCATNNEDVWKKGEIEVWTCCIRQSLNESQILFIAARTLGHSSVTC